MASMPIDKRHRMDSNGRRGRQSLCFAWCVALLVCFGCSNSDELANARAETEAARQLLESERAKARTELADIKLRLAKAEAAIQTQSGSLGSETARPPIAHPDPAWTAKQLMTAYFEAPSVAHRVALVKDAERVGRAMQIYYQAHSLTQRPTPSITVMGDSNGAVGSVLIATAKFPNESPTTYEIVRTVAGLRIDWEASRKEWQKAEEFEFRASHGLQNAVIAAKLERASGASENSGVRMAFRFTNRSDALIENATVKVSIFGDKNLYLGRALGFLTNLPANGSRTEEFTFVGVEVPMSSVRSRKIDISQITIDTGEGRSVSVDRYFSLEEEKPTVE